MPFPGRLLHYDRLPRGDESDPSRSPPDRPTRQRGVCQLAYKSRLRALLRGCEQDRRGRLDSMVKAQMALRLERAASSSSRRPPRRNGPLHQGWQRYGDISHARPPSLILPTIDRPMFGKRFRPNKRGALEAVPSTPKSRADPSWPKRSKL
jgi:hypothetical protein